MVVAEFFCCLGGLVFVRSGLGIVRRFGFYWRKLDYGKLKSQIGENFVLVTGATDGIGRCLALKLARGGLNLIVHGRSQEKLGALVEELRKEAGERSRV